MQERKESRNPTVHGSSQEIAGDQHEVSLSGKEAGAGEKQGLDEATRQRLIAAGLVEAGAEDRVGVLTQEGETLWQALSLVRSRVEEDKLRYDAGSRELWRGFTRLKVYRRHAQCQEAVLESFEQQGWPQRIENPLGDEWGLDRKERLRETVKSLNEGLKSKGIRFHADGTGGVRWESVDENNVENGETPPPRP
jgi:hypothetical protein